MAVKTLSEEQWSGLSPKRITQRDRDILEYLELVKAGKIIEVTPDAGTTVRGLKASITRRAKSSGIRVEYRDTAKGFAMRAKAESTRGKK